MTQGWEGRAEQWLRWARTPGHDAYWDYRDAFFELLPAPAVTVLEVGCGEGRVCRDLAARGYRVTALDASPALVAAAAERDLAGEYLVGQAEALPFEDSSFALVVAYNSLMDVEDMPRAVAEAARVLQSGGRLCACVTHPLADAGAWEGDQDDARFVITDSYLEPTKFSATVERAGLAMTFDGKRFPLESYARALEVAGLLIEGIREPAAPAGARREARWTRLPMFLFLRALKP
jgi:SAM-dependent methyltransferase